LNRDFRPDREDLGSFYLIDRESGRCELKLLPEGERWGLLSVSPWRGERGEAEVVGQCHSLASEGDGTAFWGLARLRLPDGKLIDRVKLDILPTSRPCWLPDLPGEILFAAGDGQLYRHSLPPRQDETTVPNAPPPVVPEGSDPRPVTWRCPAPGEGTVFLADPVWPSHPRLRHLLFVTLSFKHRAVDTSLNGPPQPWWLKMSRDGTEIEAAGPVFDPGKGEPVNVNSVKRFPNVAVDRRGMIQLVYLARSPGQRAMDLLAIQLDLDPATGQPHPQPGRKPRLLAQGCAAVPPICTSDGASVYGISQESGVVAEYRVEAEQGTRGMIAMARK
jgi:hypothetical protein